ncbi:hypothetical protein ACMU_07160 [Actibacterium mucosum KCTC 23349]|uniref:Teneurin-like YD-shell domain-containing protein n=1 Tax=Actibacterium mucosum KCTC 23349 TaxID=1454373 RepID=A0A037ZJT9_9RHOB|nr:RHS repeat-associated core domain-containing protein [Actibacterium mucosum]KAJ56710.1 hypothetical protein ACMU_07160 [Actibacterium mucosum KCTC 23349]
MTTGLLLGKAMAYDAENRPLSVDDGTNVTTYVYGADGTRLKKIEKTGQGAENTTLYVGPLEIRDYGTGNESLLAYPHPNIRMVDGMPSALHKDQLNSVRMITNDSGGAAKESVYKPFGEATDWTLDPSEAIETKGFIGERYDADAGLQFLNARYYDPKLGLFIQPDWFEVTEPGVGTNRYSYSFNDPINLMDPNGNVTESDGAGLAEDTYHDEPDVGDLPDNWTALSSSELEKLGLGGVKFSDKGTGIKSRMYKNSETGEYVLGFAGSQDIGDWIMNASHGVYGTSPQHEQAAALVGQVTTALGGKKLSLVGHSLGGGLAVTGALNSNNPSLEIKVYNSAGGASSIHSSSMSNTDHYVSSTRTLVRQSDKRGRTISTTLGDVIVDTLNITFKFAGLAFDGVGTTHLVVIPSAIGLSYRETMIHNHAIGVLRGALTQ